MTKKKKGKCFACKTAWYWCQECGAAGCAKDACPQQRQSMSSGGLMSFSGLRCRVCGSK